MWLFGTLLTLMGSNVAVADDHQGVSIDFNQFRPPPDGYGYFSTPSASSFRHLQLGVSLWTDYQNDPLVFTLNGSRMNLGQSDELTGPIEHRLNGHLQLAMGFFNHLALAVELPLIFWQHGYSLDFESNGARRTLTPSGVGDIRLNGKVVVFDRDKMPIGLALAIPVSLPTGAAYDYLGEGGMSMTPMGIIEFSNGSIREREYTFRASGFAGYHVRPADELFGVAVENEVVYGGAMAIHPIPFLEVLGEYRGRTSNLGTSGDINFGLKFLAGKHAEINLGGGFGALPGAGTPDMRGLIGVTVAPVFDPKYLDPDGDGYPGKYDKCPMEPEDFDKFEDTDGCPDLDNDNDKVPDNIDKCPNKPEDLDGFEDEDGCAETDNDNDGLADQLDRCPNKAEVVNGYMDEDGCPDTRPIGDADKDGVKDDKDKCPFKPEDFDDFEDEDGCPDLDNDQDGVPDLMDKCADAREVYNRVDDEDGCPDESDRVRIVENKIEINQKIYFDFAKANIKDQSNDLLNEIASIILAHPEIKRLQIEGHTDNIGGPEFNMKLSESRAKSVREALIERNVEPGRLIAVGFGEDVPLDKSGTESSRERNRRVEFIILK